MAHRKKVLCFQENNRRAAAKWSKKHAAARAEGAPIVQMLICAWGHERAGRPFDERAGRQENERWTWKRGGSGEQAR